MNFCTKCGESLATDSDFCGNCGKPRSAGASQTSAAVVIAPAMVQRDAEERSFFRDGSVLVTNSRFVVDGQIYAMSQVSSVKNTERQPHRITPVLLVIIGFLLAISNSRAPEQGIILVAIGAIWLFVA